ncbi:ribonuclease P protein component [Brevibacillus sp. B_LB10_24]|uniref:ribonuclease P protein component n=1 Tax=Brevibacillus sp. B_LB10_24 TaxID=3380645 RepID=UPI0038B8D573
MHHSHRLKKNEDFQIVFQKGKSAANRQFVIYALTNREQSGFRAGISVSKKIGNAVVRNRVKRLIRQAIAHLEEQIMHSKDLVIIARQGVEKLTLQELESALRHAMKRAHVLKSVETDRKKRG